MWNSFIDSFIEIVKGQCKIKGFSFPSVIIAQAFLETGFFESEEAQFKITNNNFLGIKYKENRVQSFSHLFNDGGWEIEKGEKVDLDPSTLWYGFYNVAQCIVGYFEFTSASWYDKLRECTDAESYCYALKECGYATDPNYADKLINLINRYELKQYDNDVIKESENKSMKINLHAGHNPDNMVACGAIGYIRESAENRLVKNEVKRQLELLGHTVYDCTCDNGTSVSDVLQKIVAKCNANDVDLDVSIHFNAFNGTAKGTEVLVYNLAGESFNYATDIAKEISALGFVNRGVKERSDLYFLRNTKAQALLIECCFVDSSIDIALYDYKSMASAIVKGITGEVAKDVVTKNDDTMVETETNNDNTTVQELYRVQVGAFGVKANAENMLAKLKEAGFDGFITN